MHAGTSSDTISTTDGDFPVFVNHRKEFILKVTLQEAVLYGKLVDRIVAAAGYNINMNALTLTYRDFEDDKVVVSSSQELTHVISQFYDQGIVKFTCNIEPETPQLSSRRGVSIGKAACPSHGPNIPNDLPAQVNFPVIRFDPSRTASGLVLNDGNRCVTQNDSSATDKVTYLTEGFSSGCMFWSFKVTNRAVHGHIQVGVGHANIDLTKSTYPGGDSSGCSLYLHNGHFYHSGTNNASAVVSLVKEASVIGVLLNMDHKTVTFYADGKRVGTGAGANVLTAREYFPVVALYELGHCVEVMDIVDPVRGRR